MMEYVAFDVSLERNGAGGYLAHTDAAGSGRVKHGFELRMDTLKMRDDLRRLEMYAVSSDAAKDDFPVEFGRMLSGCVLGGAIGMEFAARVKEMRRLGGGVRLTVRVAEDAPELMTMPWELLHDGEDFLVTRTETPISRLPVEVEREERPALDRALRMLVIVSSPLNLPAQMVLNTEKEQEVILSALDKLQRKHLMEIDFCEDATMDTIQDYLSEQEYDILHFTGHGVFHEGKGYGEILLEDEQGNQHAVSNVEFAGMVRNHPSLRLIVLSACQSARAANNTAYADMASRLAMQGTPSVLAMQYSVLDDAATLFADRFYTGLANNKAIDVALTEARFALRLAGKVEGGERIDFATPVLFLRDPNCVKTAKVKAGLDDVTLGAPFDFGTVSVMDRGFVGRRRELRTIRGNFLSGRQRAVILHGLGGMGKSVLATRAATKMHKSFRGLKAVRMTATTRVEDILSDLNSFLNLSGVSALNQHIHAQVPLATKTGVLVQILTQLPYLILFDNCEDVLNVVRGARGDEAEGGSGAVAIADPDLATFFETLIQGVAKGSKFLFTTRYDFDPARGRLVAEVGHIALGELAFAVAAQCMNNHDALAALPVAAASRGRNDGKAAPGITKHELYRRIGGHPYTIDVFARAAAITSVADVWLEIESIERKMVEFTLLDRTYAQLPKQAQTLLIRLSVLREAASLEMIQWLMSDADAASTVDAEIQELLRWGMLVREETTTGVLYPMHALVRDHAHDRLAASGEDESALLKRAGRFWEIQVKAAAGLEASLECGLKARDYYYAATEYELAWSLVEGMTEWLMRLGSFELLLRLLSDSVSTTTGMARGNATFHLANLYHDLGDIKTALKIHKEALAMWTEIGDPRKMQIQHHEVGANHHSLGEFKEARFHYMKSLHLLKARKELTKTERFNRAMTTYQLATLEMDVKDLKAAAAGLEKARRLWVEEDEPKGIATTTRELGQIDFAERRYERALSRAQQSMAINLTVKNKQGVAHCLSLAGKSLYEMQRNSEAATSFEKAMSLFSGMGMRVPAADCLYRLGLIHKREGNLQECLACAYSALATLSETGAHSWQMVASFLERTREELGDGPFESLSRTVGWELQSITGPEGKGISLKQVSTG